MDDRLQQLGKQYGGTFAGNGVAQQPNVGNPNKPQTYFDANSNQHFTFADGKLKSVSAPANKNQGFIQKLGAVGTQALHIGESAIGAGAKFIANTPKYLYQGMEPFLKPLAETFTGDGSRDIANIHNQQTQLEKNSQMYMDLYKSGKMDKDQYVRLMQDNASGFQELSKNAQDVQAKARNEGSVRSVAIGAASTAATILSAGTYRSANAARVAVAGKGFTVLAPVTKVGIEKVLGDAAIKTELALQKIPAFRDMVTGNLSKFTTESAKQLAGETTAQFIGRNSRDLAVGMLLKYPIIYQSNIGLADDLYNHLLTGDVNAAVKDAAWIGSQAVGGGPIGWFLKNGKKLGVTLGRLANGKGSFIDEVSKRIGNSAPNQMRDYLESLKGTKDFDRAERIMRIAQEVNLRVTNEDVGRAADSVTNHYAHHAIDLASLTPQRLVDDLDKWSQADEIARNLSPKEGGQYVAVRWDKAAKNALADKIEAAGDNLQDMVKVWDDMAAQPGVGWGNNQILMAKIGKAISEADSAASVANEIRNIRTAATVAEGIPKAEARRLEKLGYSLAEPFGGRKTPSVDFADTRRLVSSVADGSDIFDPAVAPHPELSSLASTLRKFGVSPESNTTTAYDKLSEALVSNLDVAKMSGELGLVGDDPAKGAKFILSRLQTYIDDQKPNPYLNAGTFGRGTQSALQDVRQMNVKEILEALPGTSKEQGKAIQAAIKKSYTDVPLEFRGLGVKATDYAYRVPGAATYYRIQSALRYVYNPFFRAQELAETKIMSHLKANNLLWLKPKSELDRVGKVLDDSGIFTSGYTGEAAQDLTVGRIHANLLQTQKRDLAGLASTIAEKKGISVEDMVRDHPDELADALKVIVQYPSKGVLNSPLARTINLAFFPMRYNLKVAGMVAQEVAKLPPTVQTAFVHSMFKMSDWMKSPEGIQWQSDNADAIQVFSYFTPVQNVEGVLNLLHGKPDSVGSLGLLGGLPFGFISQVLDAEGIVHLNTPYVDPKTGNVMPDYIPQTTKARAATAIEGLLNSMFSYPGRTLGLPGKAQFVRSQVDTFLKTGNADYLKQIRTEDLTPLQKKWISVLGDPDVTQEKLDELYTTPAPGQFNWYTLPPMNLPKPVKVLTKTEILQEKQAKQGSASSGKKKALPIPAEGQQLAL